MWEEFSLVSAWRAVRRFPALLLVPVLWDALRWLLAALVTTSGYYFRLWDFAVGYGLQFDAGYVRFVLPPTLPSAAQLGAQVPAGAPDPSMLSYLIMAVALLMSACVKGGFLRLLSEALQGVRPSLKGFLAGAGRFGPRLALIGVAWGSYSVVQAPPAANLVVVALLYTAEFVTVAADTWSLPAILGGPLLLWEGRGPALAALGFAGLTSGAATALAGMAGVAGPVLLVPAQALLGTVAAAAMLQVFQTDAPGYAPDIVGPRQP